MFDLVRTLFWPEFPSHGCTQYSRPELLWLHAISDGLLTASFGFIFVTLLYIVRKRQQALSLCFRWVFVIFGLFVLASAATHLIEVWTLWHGAYELVGILKALSAIASIAVSIALVVMLPKLTMAPGASKTNEAIAAQSMKIETLARYHVSRIEEERRRISRELHDDVGQSLIAVKLKLHSLVARFAEDIPELREELASLRQLANVTLGQVTALDRRLRPPALGTLGLDRAIAWLSTDQQKQHGLTVHLDVEPSPRLSEAAETAIYRIAQEGLANVARHASATQIWIRLRCTDVGIEFSLRDDGEGFDPDAVHDGLGLLGMKDRAAMLKAKFGVTTKRNEGTTITVCVPLERNTPSEELHGVSTQSEIDPKSKDAKSSGGIWGSI